MGFFKRHPEFELTDRDRAIINAVVNTMLTSRLRHELEKLQKEQRIGQAIKGLLTKGLK